MLCFESTLACGVTRYTRIAICTTSPSGMLTGCFVGSLSELSFILAQTLEIPLQRLKAFVGFLSHSCTARNRLHQLRLLDMIVFHLLKQRQSQNRYLHELVRRWRSKTSESRRVFGTKQRSRIDYYRPLPRNDVRLQSPWRKIVCSR